MRISRFRDNAAHATFELNLAPMMDMFVSIIPFMMLSVSFMQIMLIDVPLPVPVSQALADDRAQTKREVAISIKMENKLGFAIDVKDERGRNTRLSVGKIGSDFDYVGLHKKLVEVKQRFPKVFRVELNPDDSVDYKSIVQAMDASRSIEKNDPKIMIDKTESPLLFPDVILSNVMG
ncbi:MAG: biopolymer transporter ExbD [Oligoflexia bacterium]|nr:biopolymer transporter ExbD [Oligoflexia bacterium]